MPPIKPIVFMSVLPVRFCVVMRMARKARRFFAKICITRYFEEQDQRDTEGKRRNFARTDMEPRMLDDRDRKILELLQRNAAMPVTDLAATVSLSVSACSRRILRLENDGYISGRRA